MLSHNSDTTLTRTSYTLLCFPSFGIQPRSIIFAGQRINSGTNNQFLSNPDAISAELRPTPVKFWDFHTFHSQERILIYQPEGANGKQCHKTAETTDRQKLLKMSCFPCVSPADMLIHLDGESVSLFPINHWPNRTRVSQKGEMIGWQHATPLALPACVPVHLNDWSREKREISPETPLTQPQHYIASINTLRNADSPLPTLRFGPSPCCGPWRRWMPLAAAAVVVAAVVVVDGKGGGGGDQVMTKVRVADQGCWCCLTVLISNVWHRPSAVQKVRC